MKIKINTKAISILVNYLVCWQKELAKKEWRQSAFKEKEIGK